jgi:hypothetical protein
MAAGAAEGVDVWNLSIDGSSSETPEATDTFMPTLPENGLYQHVKNTPLSSFFVKIY